MRYTIILTPDEDDGGYTAECPAIPGCISEGDTVEEALANIREALEGCLESMAAHGEELPADESVIVASVDVDLPAAAIP